jgi:hypothetical protein
MGTEETVLARIEGYEAALQGWRQRAPTYTACRKLGHGLFQSPAHKLEAGEP